MSLPVISQFYTFYNDVRIRFGTDHAAFFDFVEQAHGLKSVEPENQVSDLEVQVYFHKKNTITLDRKVAHNVFFDEGQILYHDRGFTIHAKQGKLLRIDTYVEKEFIKDVYHAVRYGRQEAKRGKYLELVRKCLYLPLFYLLEKNKYVVLHGSAVLGMRNDETYVFLGANYVGKTTTALNLVLNHNFGLISDNYILVTENEVKESMIYPFPDQIRGKKDVLGQLSIQASGRAVNEKYPVKLDPIKKILFPCKPDKVFFMELGPAAEIKPMDLDAALRRLSACHNYLGEFPEHSYLAFFPDFPLAQDLQARVANFLEKSKLFTFQSGPDLSKNIDYLLKKFS